MCFNSSSQSSKSSDLRDERVGADNGSTAFRASGTNTISVGSDEVAIASLYANNDAAQMAIESSTNALTASTDFIATAFTSAQIKTMPLYKSLQRA